MSVLTRSWLCISRKKVKSIILFFILTLISTALLSSYSIKSTTNDMEKKIFQASNGGFTLTAKGGQSPFDLDSAKKLSGIAGISRHNFKYAGLGLLSNLNAVKIEQKVQINSSNGDLKNLISVNGVTDTSLENDFTSGMFKIEKGRGITSKDRNKVIIHEAFAKENNLNIGDKLKFKGVLLDTSSSNNSFDNRNIKKGSLIDLEIVGVFSGKKNELNRGLSSDATENTVFTDYNSSQTSIGVKESNSKLISATYFVSDPKNIDKIVSSIKKLPLDWSALNIVKNSKAFDNISASLKSFNSIIKVMTLGIIIGSIVVLSLVLMFWLRERIYEIGILLSIGISKTKIVCQFISEGIIISVLSYIISIFLGKLMSSAIFREIATSGSKAGTEGVFKNIVPKLDIATATMSYSILLLIITLSVIGTSIVILHKKPKEILTNMS